jgi:hypothetical protein
MSPRPRPAASRTSRTRGDRVPSSKRQKQTVLSFQELLTTSCVSASVEPEQTGSGVKEGTFEQGPRFLLLRTREADARSLARHPHSCCASRYPVAARWKGY